MKLKLKEYTEKSLLKIAKEKISSPLNIQTEFKVNLIIYTNNPNNILKTFRIGKITEISKILLPDSLDRLFISLTKKKMNWTKYQLNKIVLKTRKWVPNPLDNYFYIIRNNKQLKKSYPLITMLL